VPARYRRGLLRPPTLRVSRDGAVVRVDLPVEFPKAPRRPDNGRVLGLDRGARRALTGAVVFRLPGATRTSRPGVDGRPLFLNPASLLSKSRRLSGPRERARARVARYDRLLAGHPDPALAGKRAVLEAEVERINARQTHPRDQVARLAARWAVEQALAAGCHTIALEDLRTLEHRGLGKKTNVRVSLAMRGGIAAVIEQAAELEGPRVVKVPARGTSSLCSRRDGEVRHLTAPNGRDGRAWAVCASCGHSADRDHLAAENVGGRALAPTAGRVRHKKTKRTLLAPGPMPAGRRGPKTGPTPKRPGTQKTSLRARRRAGRAVTPPPAPPRGHRQAEPEPQGHHGQDRTTVSRPAQHPLDGLPHAYRSRLRATPVLYRRSPETPGVRKNA
jgi:transposase